MPDPPYFNGWFAVLRWRISRFFCSWVHAGGYSLKTFYKAGRNTFI